MVSPFSFWRAMYFRIPSIQPLRFIFLSFFTSLTKNQGIRGAPPLRLRFREAKPFRFRRCFHDSIITSAGSAKGAPSTNTSPHTFRNALPHDDTPSCGRIIVQSHFDPCRFPNQTVTTLPARSIGRESPRQCFLPQGTDGWRPTRTLCRLRPCSDGPPCPKNPKRKFLGTRE